MRLLLDENLDWRLGRSLPGHQVESVPLLGWAGIQNGELLRKAVEARFDVLVTMAILRFKSRRRNLCDSHRQHQDHDPGIAGDT
jgi:hypothetical protein